MTSPEPTTNVITPDRRALIETISSWGSEADSVRELCSPHKISFPQRTRFVPWHDDKTKTQAPEPSWRSFKDVPSADIPLSAVTLVQKSSDTTFQAATAKSLVVLAITQDDADPSSAQLIYDMVNLAPNSRVGDSERARVATSISAAISALNDDLQKWRKCRRISAGWNAKEFTCGPKRRMAISDTETSVAASVEKELDYYSAQLAKIVGSDIIVGTCADREALLLYPMDAEDTNATASGAGRPVMLHSRDNFRECDSNRASGPVPIYLVGVHKDGLGQTQPDLERYLPAVITDDADPVGEELGRKAGTYLQRAREALSAVDRFKSDLKDPTDLGASLVAKRFAALLGVQDAQGGAMLGDKWLRLEQESVLVALQAAAIETLQQADATDLIEPVFGIMSRDRFSRYGRDGCLESSAVTDLTPDRKKILHELIDQLSAAAAESRNETRMHPRNLEGSAGVVGRLEGTAGESERGTR